MNIYQEFANPSSTYRPIPFWYWNDIRPNKFTPALVEEQIDQMHQKGFGGFIIFNKPNNYTQEPFGFNAETYLGPHWFSMCRVAIEKGAALGMEVWINDGFDYPPGGLGGRMKKLVPEAYQRELAFAETKSRPAPGDDLVSVVPHGDSFYVVRVQKPDRPEGHLNRFPSFLDPQVNAVFIREVHEKYKEFLGDLFGAKLTGFFGDCDARRASHYPWARDFEARFQQQFGYSIVQHLPALWVDLPNTPKIRHDYYSFLSGLYSGWFKNCYLWCQAHGLKYMYHTSDTGPVSITPGSEVYCHRSSYFIEGRFSEVNSYCDYVGTDHELMALHGGLHFDFEIKNKKLYWNPDPLIWGLSPRRWQFDRVRTENKTYGDIRAKMAGSLARTKGKLGAVCEAYAASWNSDRLEDLKWIADWQLSQGITKLVPQACLYSYEGYRKVVYVPNHFRQSHLWYNYKDFADYVGRVASLLSAGDYVSPIAVLEPCRSLWTDKNFNPLPFFDTLDLLNHSPWNYTVVAEEDLAANKKFPILILPGISEVSPESIKHLQDFKTVICLSASVAIPHACYLEHQTYDNEKIAIENPLLSKIAEIIAPDLLVYENGKRRGGVHFAHRKTDEGELYFIANLEAENAGKMTVNLPYTGQEPQLWNPVNAQKNAAPFTVIKNRIAIEIDLPFKASCFIFIPAKQTPPPKALPVEKTRIKLDNWTIKPEGPNILSIPSLFKGFALDARIAKCQLAMPAILNGCLNGKPITDYTVGEEMIFDCPYLICDIPLVLGKNQFVFNDIGNLIDYRNVYLRGDFLVEVKGEGSRIPYKSYYHFKNCILSETHVTLTERRKALTLCDWSKQGYPFYSGIVTYTTRFTMDTLDPKAQYCLVLKSLNGSARIRVNNSPCGTINFAPYELDISRALVPGNNEITISVRNTDANILDEYPEPSGIDDAFLWVYSDR